jgi:hypothetical protein
MADDHSHNTRYGPLQPLASLGGRAVAFSLRPLRPAIDATFEVGASLERRAVDGVLESPELERILSTALDSTRVQAALRRALESEGARQLVDSFFESNLFDRVVERLVASDALWRLIDEVAASPSVTAAISQQGLGFADQVGDEMRTRSRNADDWLERAARRLTHRHPRALPAEPDAST